MCEETRQGGRAFLCALLVFACLTVYGQTLWHDFVNYDDPLYVTRNSEVQRGLNWPGVVWAFTTDRAMYMHPLTWLSHMADCELYGLHPWGHHLGNLLFHTADSLLLFLVLARMTRRLWPSAAVAVLFAIHPLHVESVAWVAERKDVLSMLFWTACLGAYAWYSERPGVGRYLAVTLLFLLGLLSKPMVVTLPFVLLLLDCWPLGRVDCTGPLGAMARRIGRLAVEKAPLFVVTAVFSAITFAMQAQGDNLASSERYPLLARCANAVVVYALYLVKTVWPSGLTVYYPHPITRPLWQVAGAAIVLVAITVFCLRAFRRRPYLAVGWFWYLGTLVPVIEVVQAGTFSHADRYTYIPLVGIFIMAAWGAADLAAALRAPRFALPAAAGAALAALGACAIVQTACWRDSETLFRHAIAVGYGSHVAYNNIGRVALDHRRYDEARTDLLKALEIEPDYPPALHNMGILAMKLGQRGEARTYLNMTLERFPDDVDALCNLGMVNCDEGRYDEARALLTKALALKPEHVDALNNMGVLAIKQGHYDEARTHLGKALELNPNHVDALSNLGMVDLTEGRINDARTHLAKALALNPGHVLALCNMGVLAMSENRDDEAAACLKKAVEQDPNCAEAVNKLGALDAKLGRYDEARQQFTKALEMDPQCAEARNSLAWLLATCKDARFRDGSKALECAFKAAEQSEPAWYCLDTLAAAYAADGRFDEAVQTQKRAISVLKGAVGLSDAEKSRNLNDMEKRLELYRGGTAYVDEGLPTAPRQ